MPLRGIKQFNKFDLDEFLKEKTLKVTSVKDYSQFGSEDKTPIGKKVEVVILSDKTAYKPDSKGNEFTNEFEKLTIKVELPHTVSAHVGDIVEVIGGVATVYGDFQNQLSIRAEDVRPVSSPAAKGKD